MSKFYIIYIDKKPSATVDDVQAKMDKALDWFRIEPRVWVVYSSSTAETLYARLSPLVKDEGRVFICELNLEHRQGWMTKSFWEWIKKDRST